MTVEAAAPISWKYKLERVSKGYVRATVHSDDLEQLKIDWSNLHAWLESNNEKFENVDKIEALELEKLRLKSK